MSSHVALIKQVEPSKIRDNNKSQVSKPFENDRFKPAFNIELSNSGPSFSLVVFILFYLFYVFICPIHVFAHGSVFEHL